MKNFNQLSREKMKLITGGVRKLPCDDPGMNYYCCDYSTLDGHGGTYEQSFCGCYYPGDPKIHPGTDDCFVAAH